MSQIAKLRRDSEVVTNPAPLQNPRSAVRMQRTRGENDVGDIHTAPTRFDLNHAPGFADPIGARSLKVHPPIPSTDSAPAALPTPVAQLPKGRRQVSPPKRVDRVLSGDAALGCPTVCH